MSGDSVSEAFSSLINSVTGTRLVSTGTRNLHTPLMKHTVVQVVRNILRL